MRPCSLCAAGTDTKPLPGESLRATARRLDVPWATFDRHRPHARTARAIVVAEAVAECCKMCGHSPDADENVTDRMIRDARRLFAKAESAGDIRGAVVAHRELRDALRFIQKLLGPASEDTPAVEVRFTFPDSGAKSRYEQIAWETRQRGAVTDRSADVAGSSTTEDAEVSQPIVAHEEPVSVAAEPAPVSLLQPLNVNLGNFRTGAVRADDRDD
jgi:hypothetical protein